MENDNNESVKAINRSWKYWLRWLAILPSAVGGLLIGMIIVTVISSFGSWYMGENFEQSGYFLIANWVFAPFVGGALAVYWGTKAAPEHHKVVGIINFTITIILALFIFITNIEARGWFWPLLAFIAICVGGGLIMYQIFEDPDDFKFIS